MDAGSIDQKKRARSLTSGAVVPAQQLYQYDPLLVLLKDKLCLNDLWTIASVIVLPGSMFALWWFRWASTAQFWTLNNTVSILLQTFVLFPFLFMIYLLIPTSVADLFNTLKDNGVIGKPRAHRPATETYEDFVRQLVYWMDKSWWTIATLVIVTGYALYRLLLLEPHSPSPVPYWFRAGIIIVYLPLMYATCLSVIRLLLVLVFVNLLFSRFTIQIKPLHPDGSGGLGALGRLLWISVGIMLWEALLLGASRLASNLYWFSPLEMFLLGAIYVVLTPALLIGWLVLPHRMMVKVRDEALRPIIDELQPALLRSISSTGHDTRSLVTETRRLVVLKQRYDLIRDTFPVWPLEINAVSPVLITAILPALLPLVLPAVISLVLWVSRVF